MRGSRGSDGWRVLRRLVPAAAALLALATAAPAVAAPPPNDNFADAVELTAPDATATSTTVGATKEPGEPGPGTNSVWYRYTAPNTDDFGIEVCNPWDEQASAVYTGTSVDALTLRASIGHCELVVKPAFAGEVLYIRVRPLWGHAGDVNLKLHPGPGNDDFPGTLLPSTATGSPAVDTFAATQEESEDDTGFIRHSVWWTWQPTGSVAVADVCMDSPGDNSMARIEAYVGDTLAGRRPAADQAHFACRGDYQWTPPPAEDGDTVVRWTPGPEPVRLRTDGAEALRQLEDVFCASAEALITHHPTEG